MNPGQTFILTPRSYYRVIDWVRQHGQETAPRGEQTTEMIAATLLLKNPRDRIIPDRGRKMNLAFGVAEWWAFMTGRTDIEFFTQFISGFERFSSDGKTLDGNYGTRVNYSTPGHIVIVPEEIKDWRDLEVEPGESRSQIDAVIKRLQQDPDSRQAVIALYDRNDLFGGGGKNTPCTLNLQFFIREGQLHCVTNMRSNDVIKGLTYDLFVFTMIQEYVASQLGLPLGQYIHHAASLHYYHADRAILDRLERNHRWPYVMAAMPAFTSDDLAGMKCLVDMWLEDSQMNNEHFAMLSGSEAAWSSTEVKNYLVDLASVMKAYVCRKSNPEMSRAALGYIKDPTIKFVIRQSLKTAGVI